MAGAGYKLFNSGDILTAAQVNTFLMQQTIMVFASSTARTTALSGVLAEGMVSYLQDTNATEVYDGSAWVAIGNTGDITSVGVTSPITGGGTSGAVTIGIDDGTTAQKGAVQLEDSTSSTSTTKAATPNSVKTAYDLANGAIAKSLVDAKGDLIVASANDAVARLAVGTDGQVLTADAASTNGIKWATASGGSSGPAFKATKSSSQSISSGAYVKLAFGNEVFDTDNCFDPTTNYRFTPNKAGYYSIIAGVCFSASSASNIIVRIYKNGSNDTEVWSNDGFTNEDMMTTAASLIYLNGTTDYIELYGYHGGSSPSVPADGSQFSAIWIRS